MRYGRDIMGIPVRRKLFACCAAYLSGIYLTGILCIPAVYMAALGVIFLALGAIGLRRRKRVLLCICALLLLLGNWRAANRLKPLDEATNPGVRIEGVVAEKISETRVRLEAVCIDGDLRLKRPAVVTLMAEDEEDARTVWIGQRVEGTGRLFAQETARNPGGVDWRISALCDGYELSGYLVPGWYAAGEARFSLKEAFRLAKLRIGERIATLFGEEAPLVQAVMIGEKAEMDDADVQAMRLTGIAHLLTVSGMHMSLVAQAVFFLLKRMRVKRNVGFVLQTVLLGSFVYLVGGAAGTVRAYIMAMLRALADRCGRRYDPLTALATAALVMTLIQPVWALSASFQFSFFVVLGIQLLSGQMRRRMAGAQEGHGLRRRMATALALSMSAQLAALPMQLSLYGFVPLLALPMNLLSGMLLPVMMLGGWTAFAISLLSMRAGMVIAACVSFCAHILEQASAAAASCSWGIMRLPAPQMWMVLIAALLMLSASRQIALPWRRRPLCAALSVLLLLCYLPRFDMGAKYVQLDVGQGDAAVLRQGRHAVLVDVGPADAYDMLRYLRHEGLFVDTVILSHLDEDHAGALGMLLESEIGIGRVAMADEAVDKETAEVVLLALGSAAQQRIPLETYSRGEVIDTGIARFDVLSPTQALKGSNERSLVLHTELDGMRILTLGDLPTKCEMEVVPPCDILKVAHHGSRYATSKALIEQACPQTAIISVGRNSYGHPTDRVLMDLDEVGAQVFRTDVSGCLTVKMDEGACVVDTFMKQ